MKVAASVSSLLKLLILRLVFGLDLSSMTSNLSQFCSIIFVRNFLGTYFVFPFFVHSYRLSCEVEKFELKLPKKKGSRLRFVEF